MSLSKGSEHHDYSRLHRSMIEFCHDVSYLSQKVLRSSLRGLPIPCFVQSESDGRDSHHRLLLKPLSRILTIASCSWIHKALIGSRVPILTFNMLRLRFVPLDADNWLSIRYLVLSVSEARVSKILSHIRPCIGAKVSFPVNSLTPIRTYGLNNLYSNKWCRYPKTDFQLTRAHANLK